MTIRALLASSALVLALTGAATGADDAVPAPAPAPAPAPTPPAPAAPATGERGFVGFTPFPLALLPEEVREEVKTSAKEGIVVVQVLPGGPAAKAGLRLGDRLLRYADQALPDTKDLDPSDLEAAQETFGAAFQKIAETVKVGAKVAIVVEREGKPVTLEVVALERAAIERLAAAAGDDDGEHEAEPARAYVGFSMGAASRLTPKQRERWKITALSGVVAFRVLPGSPAATAGLKDGDVLTQVAGKPVPDASKIDAAKPETLEAFAKGLGELTAGVKAGDKVALVVQREGKPVTLEAAAVPLDEIARLMKAAGWDDDEEDEIEEQEVLPAAPKEGVPPSPGSTPK